MALTPLELQHSAAVEEAARWLADQSNPPQPIVIEMKARFGLKPRLACEAINLAGDMRLRRAMA
jgi:hypothetical protein